MGKIRKKARELFEAVSADFPHKRKFNGDVFYLFKVKGNKRDAAKIAETGVYWTPAVRVDGTLKCSGRVPSLKEARGWLQHSSDRTSTSSPRTPG